jgi:hypothetical protein
MTSSRGRRVAEVATEQWLSGCPTTLAGSEAVWFTDTATGKIRRRRVVDGLINEYKWAA